MRGKSLMIQGTASSVGKSVLYAALLRIFRQDGLRCAPFKAQNMALNAYVTRDGLEMGRAQAMQAQAAGIEPDVRMNPVLLKPTGDRRSQVILDGKAVGSLSAMEFHRRKGELRGHIRSVYDSLEREVDCVVIEGAGSPAEINLRESDIVNMAMAKAADAPVILVGDINPGGVFAALLGTVMLLKEKERARVRGVIINKFRGDPAILEPGLRMLEERIGVPVLGVVPWMDVELEEEDGETARLRAAQGTGDIDVAVVCLPHIANFTDFQALALQPSARVRYVRSAGELSGADVVILPGTKNTIGDLLELRRRGLDAAIVRFARSGGTLIGVCGGYQMLGSVVRDPLGVESPVAEASGLGLLDVQTTLSPEKRTVQTRGRIGAQRGWLSALDGCTLSGYEIHAGETTAGREAEVWMTADGRPIGTRNREGNVLGTYLHGLFDDGTLFSALAAHLRPDRAKADAPLDFAAFREREFDRVAAVVRASLDMDAVYRILRGEA